MRELVRTNDPVLLSFVRALLDGENIGHEVFDEHTSTALAWAQTVQSRVMVLDRDYSRAVFVMTDAGLEGQIHVPD